MPYKVQTMIETYEGDWTAEEIDAGLAGKPKRQIVADWYENTGSGPQKINDSRRIKELERRIKENA